MELRFELIGARSQKPEFDTSMINNVRGFLDFAGKDLPELAHDVELTGTS
jgi:hypothetical protein